VELATERQPVGENTLSAAGACSEGLLFHGGMLGASDYNLL